MSNDELTGSGRQVISLLATKLGNDAARKMPDRGDVLDFSIGISQLALHGDRYLTLEADNFYNLLIRAGYYTQDTIRKIPELTSHCH